MPIHFLLLLFLVKLLNDLASHARLLGVEAVQNHAGASPRPDYAAALRSPLFAAALLVAALEALLLLSAHS